MDVIPAQRDVTVPRDPFAVAPFAAALSAVELSAVEPSAVEPSAVEPFTLVPFTENCRAICERREHVVLGVSPGNSYFSVPRLTRILDWLCAEFRRVDVVVPDSALEHTYLALGYDARRASRKMRDEINVLGNRVRRAWGNCGGPRPGDGVHRMSELASHPVYRDTLAQCELAMAGDRALWRTCMDMSRTVLTARSPGRVLTDGCVERGMSYLVAELPFFLASARIFGVASSVNFYHEELPLAELVFAGASVLRPGPGQAYATIRPTSEPDRPRSCARAARCCGGSCAAVDPALC